MSWDELLNQAAAEANVANVGKVTLGDVIEEQENWAMGAVTEGGVLRVYRPSGDNPAVSAQNDHELALWAFDQGFGPKIRAHGGADTRGTDTRKTGPIRWILYQDGPPQNTQSLLNYVKDRVPQVVDLLRRFHNAQKPGVELQRPEMGLDRLELCEHFAGLATDAGRMNDQLSGLLDSCRKFMETPLPELSTPAIVHLNLRARAFWPGPKLGDFQCAVALEDGDPDLRLVDLAKVIAEARLTRTQTVGLLRNYNRCSTSNDEVKRMFALAAVEAIMTILYNEAAGLGQFTGALAHCEDLISRATRET